MYIKNQQQQKRYDLSLSQVQTFGFSIDGIFLKTKSNVNVIIQYSWLVL